MGCHDILQLFRTWIGEYRLRSKNVKKHKEDFQEINTLEIIVNETLKRLGHILSDLVGVRKPEWADKDTFSPRCDDELLSPPDIGRAKGSMSEPDDSLARPETDEDDRKSQT